MAVNEFLESAIWVDHVAGSLPEELIGARLCYVRMKSGEVRCGTPYDMCWPSVVAFAKRGNGIGDINSSEVGSGARYNSGKAPFELIPISMLAKYCGDISPPGRALRMLGLWQAGGTSDEFLNAMYALAPNSLEGWEECARVFDYGRGKYAEWNWAKGMPWSTPLACAVRHLLAMIHGEENDPESGLPHRGHVFCNLVMLWTYSHTYLAGDDRPPAALLTLKTKAENA